MISRIRTSLLSWKKKAIERREENKNLKKRITESRKSSNTWKLKYQKMAEENKRLKSELKKNESIEG